MHSFARNRCLLFTHILLAVFLDMTLATTSVVAVLPYESCVPCVCLAMILISGLILSQILFVVAPCCCRKEALEWSFVELSSEGVRNHRQRKYLVEAVSFLFVLVFVLAFLFSINFAAPLFVFALMIGCVMAKFVLIVVMIATSVVDDQMEEREFQQTSQQDATGHRAMNERMQPRQQMRSSTFIEVVGSGLFCQKSCYICLEDFVLGDGLSELPCNHVFHKNCLRSWAMHHNSCPLRCELSAKNAPHQNSIVYSV